MMHASRKNPKKTCKATAILIYWKWKTKMQQLAGVTSTRKLMQVVEHLHNGHNWPHRTDIISDLHLFYKWARDCCDIFVVVSHWNFLHSFAV